MKKKLLFKTLYHCASVFLILFMAINLTTIAQAADITSTGNGDWSSTTPDEPWPNGGVPEAGDNVTIASPYWVDLDVETADLNNFTMNSGSYIVGVSVLNMEGNLQIDGGWYGTGTVNLIGTAAQTINGSSSNLYNLTINNSAGVTLQSDMGITSTLTLTSGLLTLGNYNLTLGSSSTIGGAPSASNMIVATGDGELRKRLMIIGSFTFPVGDNTNYSPVTLNFTSGTFYDISYAGVNLKNVKNSNNTSTADFLNRYWTVTQFGIPIFSCGVSLYYVQADVVGTEANIYCGSYNGSSWTLLNVTDVDSNKLSGTVTSFSTFTGGEQSALPVELTSFTSSTSDNSVQLTWSTAGELNNAGFEIERRTVNDGAEWVKIGFVQGNGTTNEPKNYSFDDKKLSTGKYNYRLKQLDYNNKATLFDLSNAVEIGKPKKFELSQNYPNPFNPITKIDYNLPFNGNVTLNIYDISGREITTLVNNTQEAGFYTVQFNANNFASGTYFYRISASNGQENLVMTKRMLLIK